MAQNEHQQEKSNGRAGVLREAILRTFPAERYAGKITNYDNDCLLELTQDSESLDDEKYFYEAVSGHVWTEIPKGYLQREPDGFLRLSDEAFAAFLPAWLMESLENMDGENIVREFVVYSFSSDTRQFRLLKPEQQSTLRMLLVEFSEREPSSFIRQRAREAVELIDRKLY